LKQKSSKILFLDRDGTLIYDRNYISNPEQVELIPGVLKFLKFVTKLDVNLHVVSNQSGVGRNIIAREDFEIVDRKFRKIFADSDLDFSSVSYCTHKPDDNCQCRKPRLGLFAEVINSSPLPRKMAFMGNSSVDEQAANNLEIEYWNIPNLDSKGEFEIFFDELIKKAQSHFYD
jgi:histidinol-phosphate phosphatase family protein